MKVKRVGYGVYRIEWGGLTGTATKHAGRGPFGNYLFWELNGASIRGEGRQFETLSSLVRAVVEQHLLRPAEEAKK